MHISILIYLLFSSFSTTSSGMLHDIHVSKTDVHYKSDKKVLQISSHIYLDDLELDMQKMGHINPMLCTKKEHEQADSMIIDYLSAHLIFSDKSGNLEFEFIGREASEDFSALWCYLEVYSENPDQIKLTNRILLDVHDDQKNLVNAKMDGKRKNFEVLDHTSNTIFLFR